MSDSTSFQGHSFQGTNSNDSKQTTDQQQVNNKRSCDNCRKKKIRCDSHLTMPCTACQKVGIECLITSKPKKSGPPSKMYMSSLEKRIEQLESLLSEQNKSAAGDIGNNQSYAAAATSPSQQQQHPSQKFDIVFSPWMNLAKQSNSQQQSGSLVTGSNNSDKQIIHNSDSSMVPVSQAVVDMIHEIPNLTTDLVEDLMERYFTFIHPRVPVLDKRSFLLQYYYQFPEPLEKHLFYAVCAMGCQFLPRAGLTGDSSAERKIGRLLRDKAMGVMHFAYKRSSITTLQTLLMMSLLAPNSDNGEGSSTNWLVLGAAIRMSQDMEIHREENYLHMSKCEIEMRRRIAHNIYMWDKFSAAAAWKPFTIRDEDFSVQIPSDYEQEPEDGITMDQLSNDQSPLPKLLKQTEEDIHEKKPVYYIHVQSVPMSRMIGRILTSLHLTKAVDESGVSIDIDMITHLDTALIAWRQVGYEKPYDSYVLHNEIFDMLYHAGVLLLYRPLIIDSIPIPQCAGANSIQMLDLCTDAAEKIIDFMETAPVWGIPCLKDFLIIQCATVFLQNCNNEDRNTRSKARKNLHRCAAVHQIDDIFSQSQNSVLLEELSKQLPHEEDEEVPSHQMMIHQLSNENEQVQSPLTTSANEFGSSTDNPTMDSLTVAMAVYDRESNDDTYNNMLLSWQQLQREQQQQARNEFDLMMEMDMDHLVLDSTYLLGPQQQLF
ncbi:fungal-specific transcription factor domain-containing protein [Phascolomyces articulosus]|uniref:Fungal-specific transcription factor domain-containing protein n=1 Tax=Phascolomyces articulosus TaxID=60185 RepID=A0AAD5JT39_9FUNG|nr:fungal-specific transcription factor domain-containing protein [Phascolomyces articulosus]